MKAINELEKKALETLKAGKPVHGAMRDLLIDMALREAEEKNKKIKKSA